MTVALPSSGPLRVVIVGGGVAALEASLALRQFAGELVQTTLLAPNTDFVYRPMSVREPFGRAGARHYPLAPVLAMAGATQKAAALKWLDHRMRLVHDDAGATLSYDALLLAIGARQCPSFRHAITVDPDRIDQQLRGVIQDIETGAVRSITFIVPSGHSWPLPAYELALMTAARAHQMGQQPRITLVTPEASPLAVFGAEASAVVRDVLVDAEVELITATTARVRVAGQVSLRGAAPLLTDRIVALPELRGPSVPGLPSTALHGFVHVDSHGRVRNMTRVFAAGDMTDYPVKLGAVAAQQGRCVAEELTGLAGVATVAEPFAPALHGVLLGARHPLYLRARLDAMGRPHSSEVSTTPLWDLADKIHAPYLTEALTAVSHHDLSVTSLAEI